VEFDVCPKLLRVYVLCTVIVFYFCIVIAAPSVTIHPSIYSFIKQVVYNGTIRPTDHYLRQRRELVTGIFSSHILL